MKILVVGGGPAGLYAAQLLKKDDASRSVTLVERNPPDVTSGWGVVFSKGTVEYLHQKDPTVAAELKSSLAHWDVLEVRFGGERMLSGGHGFWGVGRSSLLRILRAGCERAGVELVFNKTLDDFSSFRDYDLVVAADGLHSRVREAWPAVFQPSVIRCKNKYIWLGTKHLFDNFLFAFRETPHGYFWVYAYRFDDDLSTFNIECSDETWLRAGLEGADEATVIAYCEKVFAEDLAGEKLLPNRSAWANFLTLRNRKWHHDNIVLLGDAAHTTHFTVGSGTKLALEDATALAEAVSSTSDVRAALERYEAERRPPVERLQMAALKSTAWFETLDRRTDLPPAHFAAALCMRTGELSYERLKKRDGRFIGAAVAEYAGDSTRSSIDDRPPLAIPITLRGLSLSGRVVARAAGTTTASTDDEALGAPALVVVDPGEDSLSSDTLAAWRERVTRFRGGEARFAIQLDGGSETPSALLQKIELANEAGFDALACSFGRPDAELAGRVSAIRAAWPLAKPLFVEPKLDGMTEDEVVAVARELRDAGADVLVVAGKPAAQGFRRDEKDLRIAVCDAVRNDTGLRVMAVGIATPDEANTLLLGGTVDLCASQRPEDA
jgi:anthraniloyl-CoA monooxygenase